MLKKLFIFFYLALLTLAIGHTYFHTGFPYTHDGENHLARFANYEIAVREFQIPPRFAPNLFNHYGYPVFDFNYPLGNILSLPFSFAKLNYELTFKLITFGAIFLGLWGAVCWGKSLRFSGFAQLFATTLFAFNPYLFNLVLYRGNIGEILAICLMPWLFWSVEKIRENKLTKSIYAVIVILSAAFLLSHNITAVFVAPIIILYAIIRFGRDWQIWKKALPLVLVTVALTLWFWLPALVEKGYTVLDSAGVNAEFFDHFATSSQLLSSTMQFGFSNKGPIDSLSPSLGVAQIVTLILAAIVVVKKNILTKKVDVLFSFLVVTNVLLAVGQLSFTQPFWQLIFPIAKYIQFPWRLGVFFQVLMIPLAACVCQNLRWKWKLTLIFMLFLQAFGFSHLRPVDYFHRDIIDYNFFSQSTSTLNEDRPKAFTFSDIGNWQPGPEFLTGTGSAQVATWRGSSRHYSLQVTQIATIVEPTMNFIGWQTTINGKKITYTDSSAIGGRIAYSVQPGSYTVVTKFTEWSWSRILGDSISIGIFLLFGRWLVLKHD